MRLGELTNIQSGFAFDSKMFNSNEDGIPLIRIRDLGKSIISTYYSGKYSNEFIVKKGDFLVGMDGDFRLAKWNCEDALLNQRVCRIFVDKEKLNPRYFYHFLPKELKKIEDSTSFATVKHLSVKKIQDIQIPLPPLSEQQRIADLLDAADALRQKDKALLEKYEALGQSLFLELFGDPVKNEKGWEKIELQKLCLFNKTSIKPEEIKGGTKYVALDSIEKQSGNIIQIYEAAENDIRSNKFHFDNDYILYGKLRPYLNKVALPDFEGICSTDIIPIKPIQNRTNKYFVSAVMRGNWFVEFANERVAGANLPRISPNEIAKYQIINPPLDLQNHFASQIELIQQQKAKVKENLAKSEALFQGLLGESFG